MEWIVDNKDWLFSGIGIIILGWIGKLIYKNVTENQSSEDNQHETQSLAQNQIVNINIPSGYNEINSVKNDNSLSKDTLNILFIDDEKFDHVGVLKNAGWVNTKSIKDVKRLDCTDIQRAHVIFVDINGVGCSLFPKEQGVGVAAQIKKLYPNKYVVIYSAQPQELHTAFSQVDAVLPKNADPYEYINILENLINH